MTRTDENDDRFCYKVQDYGNKIIAGCCDSSILGQTFREGDLCITVDKNFYFLP